MGERSIRLGSIQKAEKFRCGLGSATPDRKHFCGPSGAGRTRKAKYAAMTVLMADDDYDDCDEIMEHECTDIYMSVCILMGRRRQGPESERCRHRVRAVPVGMRQ